MNPANAICFHASSNPCQMSFPSPNLIQFRCICERMVKLKQFSTGLTTFRKNPSSVRSFGDKNSLYLPALLSYRSRESNNEVRWRTIATTDDNGNTTAEASSSESVTIEKTTNQLPVKGMEEFPSQTPKPVLKRSPLTAREKLRAARVLSKYNESKPAKLAMGSTVLDALRETDKGKRRPGLPEAPTNMFDDSKRGLAKEGWKFQLPGGNDLFFIAFSFVFISTIMFGTTYVVWKVGAIHFNEF